MRGKPVGISAAALLVALLVVESAPAATFNVTRTDDPPPGGCTAGDCSLREAVIAANATGTPDRIRLKARSYRLTIAGDEVLGLAGDLNLTPGAGRLTITGKGRRKTAVDGTDTDRLFEVPAGAALGLAALTLRDGATDSSGGAIRNNGVVRVANAALRFNDAGLGGGIYNANAARLNVIRTTFAGNEASFGGGLLNQNEATATVSRSVFNRNLTDGLGGAAIFNQNEAALVVEKTTIARNVAADSIGGGGIFNQNDARLRIRDSTISHNRAPLEDGGGIFAQNASLLVMTNSTVSSNSAEVGGGLDVNNTARVRLRFSTVANNRAATAGGGLLDNTVPPGPPAPPYLVFEGTIVAGNKAPDASDNCFIADPGNWRSKGGNVEGGTNTCRFTRAGDQRNAKPKLRKLARNGGPTKTHGLKASSDAVNAVSRRGCPKRDQRGIKRPQGKRCDSGSYELKKR